MQLASAKLSRVLRHCNWQGLCNSPPVQPALFAFPRLRRPRSSPSPKIPPLTFLSEPTDLCETLLSGLAESKDRESRHLTPIGQGVGGAHLEHKCYIIQKTGFLATFGSLMIYYVKVGKRQKKRSTNLRQICVLHICIYIYVTYMQDIR